MPEHPFRVQAILEALLNLVTRVRDANLRASLQQLPTLPTDQKIWPLCSEFLHGSRTQRSQRGGTCPERLSMALARHRGDAFSATERKIIQMGPYGKRV